MPRKKLGVKYTLNRSISKISNGNPFHKLQEIETDMFAIRLNRSNKFLGTKVIMVYLEVITWFAE